jgi:hypothetical protein
MWQLRTLVYSHMGPRSDSTADKVEIRELGRLWMCHSSTEICVLTVLETKVQGQVLHGQALVKKAFLWLVWTTFLLCPHMVGSVNKLLSFLVLLIPRGQGPTLCPHFSYSLRGLMST